MSFRPKTLTNIVNEVEQYKLHVNKDPLTMRTLADGLEPGTLYLVASLRPCHTRAILTAEAQAAINDIVRPGGTVPTDWSIASPNGNKRLDRYLREDICWAYSLYYHEGRAVDDDVAGTLFYLVGQQGNPVTSDGFVPPPGRAAGVPDSSIPFSPLKFLDKATEGHGGENEAVSVDGAASDDDDDAKNNNTTTNTTNNINDNDYKTGGRKATPTRNMTPLPSGYCRRFAWRSRRLRSPPTTIANTVGLARLVRVPHCLLTSIHSFLHWCSRIHAADTVDTHFDWAMHVAYHLRAHVRLMQKKAVPEQFHLLDADMDVLVRQHARDVVPWFNECFRSAGALPRPVMVSAYSVGLAWDLAVFEDYVKHEARWSICERRVRLEADMAQRETRRVEQRQARHAALAKRAYVAGTAEISGWRLERELGLMRAEEDARASDEAMLAENRAYVAASMAQFAGAVEKRWRRGVEFWEKCDHWYADEMCAPSTAQRIRDRSMFSAQFPAFVAAHSRDADRESVGSWADANR